MTFLGTALSSVIGLLTFLVGFEAIENDSHVGGSTLAVTTNLERFEGRYVSCQIEAWMLSDERQEPADGDTLFNFSATVAWVPSTQQVNGVATFYLGASGGEHQGQQPLRYAYVVGSDGVAWPSVENIDCASGACATLLLPQMLNWLIDQISAGNPIGVGYLRENATADVLLRIDSTDSLSRDELDLSGFEQCLSSVVARI
jgi:hypothetical protein